MVRALFACCLISLTITAQDNPRSCGTDAEHAERMKDPEYREFHKSINAEIDRLKAEGRIDCTAGTIEFPVAIHYNWAGIGTTVDQCMIDAAISSIDALNLDYLGSNGDLADYDALTAACAASYPASAKSTGSCISFCIAEFDHPGCSGLCDGDLAITAGQFAYPNTGGCYGDMINIFVQSGTGQLGVAPLNGVTSLGGNGPQVDASTWGGPGQLCTPNELGSTFNSNTSYNLGRTLTHEMGHYFGLQHTFVGDCNSDDGYADTPIQSDENFGTPVVINCDPNDSGNTAVNSCGALDMWCSYMDYSNDTHLFMFTTEQSDQMYASAQLSPISDSGVKCGGSAAAPTPDFNILGDLPVFCTNDSAPFTISLEDNSTRCPTVWSWSFAGAGVSPSTSTIEDPMVTVSASGELTVTLMTTNASGESVALVKTVYVSIADAGSCPDCGDAFYDSGGPNSDYSASESNTWTYCADPGDLVNMTLNSIDLPDGLFTDEIRIFEGTSVPADLSSYAAILGENNGSGGGFWVPNGTGSVGYEGTSFKSTTNCVTMLFESNGVNEGAGWDVTMTCCPDDADPECANANLAGQGFQATVNSFCNSKSIFDLDFKGSGDMASSRACADPTSIPYSNNSYYEITCDGDGGDLSVDVTIPADQTGMVKTYLMGPLTGNCPSYTGGNLTIRDCDEGDNGTLTITENNVAPNSRYLVFINSENGGAFDLASTAASNALPIELSSFDAEVSGQDVQLSWTSVSEVNNDYFTIERSMNGTDYEYMTDLDSKGNTATGFKYDFLDTRAQTGANYYRLSQTDLDGASTIVAYAVATIRASKESFTLYPNPAAGNRITIAGLIPSKTHTIKMTNAVGEMVSYKVESNNRGEGSVEIAGLANGIYVVSATDGEQTQVTKFVRLK